VFRFWQYEYIPFQSDGDELAYVFAGQSLLETGIPTSWTSFEYPAELSLGKVTLGDKNYFADGEFAFVSPWLDHPPLLAIISGFWVRLFGYAFPSIPPSMILRFPTVLLSIATLYLTYKVASKEFGHSAGILSVGLLATSPSIIFAQRMLVGENWIIPLLLLAIVCVQQKKNIIFPIVLAVLAALIKVTGLLVIPIVFIALLQEKKYRRAMLFSLASIFIFVLLYALYGYLIDWSQFTELLAIQSHRLIGWGNFTFLLSHPGFHTISILDASYYLIIILGLFGMTLDAARVKSNRFITISAVFALFLIWTTSAEQDMLGWYKLPLFILLAILGGRGLGELLKKKSTLLLSSLMIFMIAISNLALIKYPEHPLPEAIQLRMVLGIVSCIFTIFYLFQEQIHKKYMSYFFIISITALIISTGYVVENYYSSLCKDRHCPVPTKTTRGWVKSVTSKMYDK